MKKMIAVFLCCTPAGCSYWWSAADVSAPAAQQYQQTGSFSRDYYDAAQMSQLPHLSTRQQNSLDWQVTNALH
jgi:hypothetical protein